MQKCAGSLLRQAAVLRCSPGRPLRMRWRAGLPTAITLACEDGALARALANRIARPHFRPYVSDDVIGAEIGGAVKNVLAIACGVVEGRGLGQNARAALIARGFAEMTRFGLARGARAETLAGLSGLGDLVLTCSSTAVAQLFARQGLGRRENRRGTAGGPAHRGRRGVHRARPASRRRARRAVEMPVVDAVCALLDGAANVDDVVRALLARPLRGEG